MSGIRAPSLAWLRSSGLESNFSFCLTSMARTLMQGRQHHAYGSGSIDQPCRLVQLCL